MKTMIEYIEGATNFLMSVSEKTKPTEIRNYITKHHSDWSEDEQEDMLLLASTISHWEEQGISQAISRITVEGMEYTRSVEATHKRIRKFRLHTSDKREAERRRATIDRHFGSALRGEIPTPNEDDEQ